LLIFKYQYEQGDSFIEDIIEYSYSDEYSFTDEEDEEKIDSFEYETVYPSSYSGIKIFCIAENYLNSYSGSESFPPEKNHNLIQMYYKWIIEPIQNFEINTLIITSSRQIWSILSINKGCGI